MESRIFNLLVPSDRAEFLAAYLADCGDCSLMWRDLNMPYVTARIHRGQTYLSPAAFRSLAGDPDSRTVNQSDFN